MAFLSSGYSIRYTEISDAKCASKSRFRRVVESKHYVV